MTPFTSDGQPPMILPGNCTGNGVHYAGLDAEGAPGPRSAAVAVKRPGSDYQPGYERERCLNSLAATRQPPRPAGTV